jgi:hypothetical protein
MAYFFIPVLNALLDLLDERFQDTQSISLRRQTNDTAAEQLRVQGLLEGVVS